MSVPGQPASHRPSLAPAWLDHLAALGWRVLVTVALAAVVIWLALVLSTITASVLIAVIIAATFAPLATALRNRGWSRTKTAAVVTVGAILVITAVIVLIVLAFVPYVPEHHRRDPGRVDEGPGRLRRVGSLDHAAQRRRGAGPGLAVRPHQRDRRSGRDRS